MNDDLTYVETAPGEQAIRDEITAEAKEEAQKQFIKEQEAKRLAEQAEEAKYVEDVYEGEKSGPTLEPSEFEKRQARWQRLNQLATTEQNALTDFNRLTEVGARGVGDTVIRDAMGLVPWLKPASDWYKKNMPQEEKNITDQLVRDASAIIIPSLVSGGVLTGVGRAATVTTHTPKALRILGEIGVWAGVDTGVAAITAQSYEDPNFFGMLGDWLGWYTPWATMPGDSPDIRRHKHIYEAAGMSGATELLGALFNAAYMWRLKGKTPQAQQIIQRPELYGGIPKHQYQPNDPLSSAVEEIRFQRDIGNKAETVSRIEADIAGKAGHDPFINISDDAARAVPNTDADIIGAKIDHAIIQKNKGSVEGRARSVATEHFQKKFMHISDGTERAEALNELFSPVSEAVEARAGDLVVTAQEANQAIDVLTNSVFDNGVTVKQFETIMAEMRTSMIDISRNSGKIETIGEEQFLTAANALKRSFYKMYDTETIKASAMLTQNAADTVIDNARAIDLLEGKDTFRQQQIIFEKMSMLADEVSVNQYLSGYALQNKNLLDANGGKITPKHMEKIIEHEAGFESGLAAAKSKSSEVVRTFTAIAKENPEFLKPFVKAYDFTNGKVDTLAKLNRYAENNIGFIKKAFIDLEPEVPSWLVQNMKGMIYNSVLSGKAILNAGRGAVVAGVAKPASLFLGAAVTPGSKQALLQRGYYAFSQVEETFSRALKYAGDEWRYSATHPEESMMRGRHDYLAKKLDNYEIMEDMSKGWEENGKMGKVAMWNLAKTTSNWNDNKWARLGVRGMGYVDAFTGSMMTTMAKRFEAYDHIMKQNKGAFNTPQGIEEWNKLQNQLYNEAFTPSGELTDLYAKHATGEIALNLDNPLVDALENLIQYVPAARSVLLFPRTGMNSLSFNLSFLPTGGWWQTAGGKIRSTLKAQNVQDEINVLIEHGIIKTADEYSPEAFKSLKAEYIGRQMLGAGVVTGIALWAMQGNVTGFGDHRHDKRQKMRKAGWQDMSIRLPGTQQWVGYKGLEPFDKLIALTADAVYNADRIDSSITEQTFQKLAFAVAMGPGSSTFLPTIEPLLSIFSGDKSAFNRLVAGQVNALIPGAGARSMLNNMVTGLKDIENDMLHYLANRNKFLFSGNEHLPDLLDIYTGEPIRYWEPLTRVANAINPFFQVNGGIEPWRQSLLRTGWTGLQEVRTNPLTAEPVSTQERYFLNNWIAENYPLKDLVKELLSEEFTEEFLRDYQKAKGLKNQKQFPLKKSYLYNRLDDIHNEAYELAWNALFNKYDSYEYLSQLKHQLNNEIELGEINKAAQTSKQIESVKKTVPKILAY